MKKIAGVVVLIIALISCAQKKNLVYFNNSKKIENEFTNYKIILKKNDILNIVVLGADENTNKLFNLPEGQSAANRGYLTGSPVSAGYLIDNAGEINFPLVGKIKVEGLDREQTIKILEEKISQYIEKPIVQIQIQNF